MSYRNRIDEVRRFLHRGRPSRAIRARRRPRFFLEALETRMVLSPPSVPTGLVQLIANDNDNGDPRPLVSGQPNQLSGLQLDINSISSPMFQEFSGVAFQIDWRDVEPIRPVSQVGKGPGGPVVGQPDWSRIDAVLAAAQQAGKWVQLFINPGFFSPSWVLAPFARKKNDKFPIQYGQDSGGKGQTGPAMPLPIPWNQNYLNEWFAFLKLVRNRYESNPLYSSFRMIAAAGPTSVSCEMTEPDNAKENAQWKTDGYTPNKYIGAWKQVFKTYKQDFPNQYVSLSHGNDVALPFAVSVDNTRDKVVAAASRILNDFHNQFTYQSSALSGLAVHHNEAINSIIDNNGILTTGFQLGTTAEGASASVGAPGDPALALTLAIENGMALNTSGKHADYLEIHDADFVDVSDSTVLTDPQPVAELQPVLRWAASLFEQGKVSVFDQTSLDPTTNTYDITVDTDPHGDPVLTIYDDTKPKTITFKDDDVTSIDIYPQIYVDTPIIESQQVNNIVRSTSVPVTITNVPFPVPALSGYSGFNPSADDITVGNKDNGLARIFGQVTVKQDIASNPTTLNIDDAADAAARTAIVTDNSVLNLAPAPIVYRQDDLVALNIQTSSQAYTSVYVQSTSPGDGKPGDACTTSITTSFFGRIIVRNSTDGVQDIQGALDISNSGGNQWKITIDDSADSKKKRNVTITGSSVTDLAPAPINYDLEIGGAPVTIKGGSGGSTFTVVSLPSQSMDLNTGSGDDTVIVEATGGSDNPQSPAYTLSMDGGLGTNTLVNANSSNTWQKTGADSGKLGAFTYTSFQKLEDGT
jgi:hypothetical protein